MVYPSQYIDTSCIVKYIKLNNVIPKKDALYSATRCKVYPYLFFLIHRQKMELIGFSNAN